MGRFTAWMASRSKAQRTANAAARARRNARPLSFERCEQRIALSTNAALESTPDDPVHVKAYWHEPFGTSWVLTPGASLEGGAISLDSYRVLENWHFLNNGNSVQLFMSDAAPTVAGYGFTFDSSAADLSNNRVWMRFSESSTLGFVDRGELTSAIADSGLFITEGHIVPIPPPSHEPQGGNEGGHIAMTPFIAPSMLGLPGGPSQLAAQTRQSLTAEQLQSAPVAGSQQDSLRGRAVVYEVAHAQTADAPMRNAASTRLKLDRPADEAAATNEFEFLAGSARTTVLDDSERPVVHEASLSASGAHSHRVLQTVEQRAVEIEHREFPIADDSLVVQTGEQTSRPADDSAVVAAHDAAFEKLEDEFEPIGERQEVAAATVDLHGKRVLGGALIAVAAIPVAKVVRRHGQRPSEARPRRATPAT